MDKRTVTTLTGLLKKPSITYYQDIERLIDVSSLYTGKKPVETVSNSDFAHLTTDELHKRIDELLAKRDAG